MYAHMSSQFDRYHMHPPPMSRVLTMSPWVSSSYHADMSHGQYQAMLPTRLPGPPHADMSHGQYRTGGQEPH